MLVILKHCWKMNAIEIYSFKSYEKYRLIIVNEQKANSNTVVMRATISNFIERNKFVDKLKMLTNTGWIYYFE